jgi:hypothetical protein
MIETSQCNMHTCMLNCRVNLGRDHKALDHPRMWQLVSSSIIVCNLDVKSHVAPQRTFPNPELVNPCQAFNSL